jgi:pimeloyl-ACP methyl ester carboxylesterase
MRRRATRAPEALMQRALSGGLLRAPILEPRCSIAGAAWNGCKNRRATKRFSTRNTWRAKRVCGTSRRIKAAARAVKGAPSRRVRGDWRAAWRETEGPALLVWGRNAQDQGFESSSEWGALRPDARLEVIDEAMLFPHIEQPAAFCDVLLPFLKRKRSESSTKAAGNRFARRRKVWRVCCAYAIRVSFNATFVF